MRVSKIVRVAMASTAVAAFMTSTPALAVERVFDFNTDGAEPFPVECSGLTYNAIMAEFTDPTADAATQQAYQLIAQEIYATCVNTEYVAAQPVVTEGPACYFAGGITPANDLSVMTLTNFVRYPQYYTWNPQCNPVNGVTLPTGWTLDQIRAQYRNRPFEALNVQPREAVATPTPTPSATPAPTPMPTPTVTATPGQGAGSGSATNTNTTNTTVNITNGATPTPSATATPAVKGASTVATPAALPAVGGESVRALSVIAGVVIMVSLIGGFILNRRFRTARQG